MTADLQRLAAALADADDLAALRRLEAALVAADARAFDAHEAAARAEAEVARVVGQVAHDLNNPLAAVSMSLEIARDQVDDSQQLLVSLLERASGSAARMKRMTADLLDHAHEPSAGTTDLQAELEAVLAALEGLLPSEVVVQGTLPTVPGAPGDWRVVLTGLLENAVKFATDGAAPRVVVAAESHDDRSRVTVTDDGRGIPAEDRERVLEPMVRLDKRVPGLGLGLATVRRVVTAHGGEVGVEEGPGGGTTVWLSLPVTSAS
ncbi:sensor histidine kinase [Nocardioides solisilvae]|uniref:sensor histidine kinase n=1 Tax=Nocardioides solisilvae TaxID=1542435 RepID=UPI0013A58DFE|nr:HAMP domain-containing sensor histidine kinase [Nocardioides solisilvae]